MSRDAVVLRPLCPDEVRREIAELAEAGVEAIAVCLLHSYRNRAHERAVAAVADREFLAIAVSLSAEVVPELANTNARHHACQRLRSAAYGLTRAGDGAGKPAMRRGRLKLNGRQLRVHRP